jgi:hypothetical protein
VAYFRVIASEQASGVNFPAICLQNSQSGADHNNEPSYSHLSIYQNELSAKMFPLGHTSHHALAIRTTTAITVTVSLPLATSSIVPGASFLRRRTYFNTRYSIFCGVTCSFQMLGIELALRGQCQLRAKVRSRQVSFCGQSEAGQFAPHTCHESLMCGKDDYHRLSRYFGP